ncbi:MAG: hypothetical protein AAFY60_16770 [Myxococcota bacterium]
MLLSAEHEKRAPEQVLAETMRDLGRSTFVGRARVAPGGLETGRYQGEYHSLTIHVSAPSLRTLTAGWLQAMTPGQKNSSAHDGAQAALETRYVVATLSSSEAKAPPAPQPPAQDAKARPVHPRDEAGPHPRHTTPPLARRSVSPHSRLLGHPHPRERSK